MFKILDSDATGITFSNQLTPTPTFNLFTYMYYYNGAGVGVGDFNNDGLIDLYFASNQQGTSMYLNEGDMRFRDITTQTGIPQHKYWHTGVSVVDINSDGLLDIYVCAVGQYKNLKGRNILLICDSIDQQKIPHYTERAGEYGLDFSGFSTQAAFIDYDRDNDLDLFLLNHSVNHDGNYAPRNVFAGTYDSLAGHRFYRQESRKSKDGDRTITFIDVTRQSGINSSRIGYGLGVAVSDIDLDGWPDIYVGNDFHENDYLYINQHNGTFKDESAERIAHTSQFSMGVDVADINNDAYPDIVSMDMLPYESGMLKRSLTEDDYTIFQEKIRYGYSYQYARNNLQLNRGNGRFSEIGQYAGVHATDWSWSALWMDFNNDRRKDLFVTNGIPKRMNDIDYVNFVSSDIIQQKLRNNTIVEKDISLISSFPEIKIPNQFFVHSDSLRFKDASLLIDKQRNTFSNGAAYADLDNDGDLDIVVNNINDPAFIYQNNTNQNGAVKPYTSIFLKGPSGNSGSLGTKLYLFEKGEVVAYEQQPVHGFLSSMQVPMHIGLDGAAIDSLLVVWPDQTCQQHKVRVNQLDTIVYTFGLPTFDPAILKRKVMDADISSFQDITARAGIRYVHRENPFKEFDRETLTPRMVSTEGPAIAVADINHDGKEDFFIGSSKSFQAAVYLQKENGQYTPWEQPQLKLDSMWEHVDAVWTDVNADTHPDLLIATGGNEYYGGDIHQTPLLYLNDGRGNLSKKTDAFTNIFSTQSQVAVQDINGDGYPDVFLAGRAEPWKYGIAPRSYLLQNDGNGRFTDVTAQYSEQLTQPGMVTSAQWVDLDGDKVNELLLTYEWGGIDAFAFKNGKAIKHKLIKENGWWQSITPVDVDLDGDLDLVAFNFGLNSRLQASLKEPVTLYVNDFDDNDNTEQLLTYFLHGQEVTFSTKTQLEKRMPVLKKKFLYAAEFAKASVKDLFGEKKLNAAYKLQATQFAHILFINNGGLSFSQQPLPEAAQWTTYRTAVPLYANGDSLPDLLMMGNFFDYNVEIGRQDADAGTLLINYGKAIFKAMPMPGLMAAGQVRKIRAIKTGNSYTYLLARNNDALLLIRQN